MNRLWPANAFMPANPTQLVHRAIIYAALFYLTHQVAANWGGPQFFSMWYPTAGVRFAALWLWGPAWILPMLLIEIAVQYFSGFVVTDQGEWAQLVSIVRAPICYGLVVYAVQFAPKFTRTNPMFLALAAMAAPALASLSAGVWGWLNPDLPPFSSGEPPLLIATAFLIGDLLGVILLVPLLIWVHQRLVGPKPENRRPRLTVAQIAEIVAVFISGSLLGILFLSVDASISLMPMTLSISWIGLRYGRAPAWLALSASAAAILTWSMNNPVVADLYEFHIAIAMASIAAFLSGSFSDAQWIMLKQIERRDRMLFQAERLKSVKAMSLAVIHDASQPLTTLSLEAQYLAELSKTRPLDANEVEASAAMIQRKVENLAEMILRMRRFGGRQGEDRTVCSIRSVMDDALALLRHDTRKLGIKICAEDENEDSRVLGYGVELTQALFNLLHNAAMSAPINGFRIAQRSQGGFAEIHIFNMVEHGAPKNHGFGIGFHIARSIIEAHEGNVTLDNRGEEFHTIVKLPEAQTSA